MEWLKGTFTEQKTAMFMSWEKPMVSCRLPQENQSKRRCLDHWRKLPQRELKN